MRHFVNVYASAKTLVSCLFMEAQQYSTSDVTCLKYEGIIFSFFKGLSRVCYKSHLSPLQCELVISNGH